MTNSQRLAAVRAFLKRWLGEQAASDNAGSSEEKTTDNEAACIQSESILIVDGFYAGRTLSAVANGQSFRATWFMEQDELKIRDSHGDVVACFVGDEILAVSDLTQGDPDSSPSEEPAETIAIPIQSEQDDKDDDRELPQAA